MLATATYLKVSTAVRSQRQENENCHQISLGLGCNNRISLGSKYQLQQTIFNFVKQICHQKDISVQKLTRSVFERKYSFSNKFISKNQNCLLKLKFAPLNFSYLS